MRELTNDELAKLTDDRLRDLFLKVRSKINRAKREEKPARKEEVYFCYVCREIERRASFKVN